MKKVIISLFICMLSVGGVTAAEVGNVDIHGFVSQGYLYSDENNFLADTEGGTTQFNEVGVNFSSDVTDRLRVGLQLLSRDLGEFGNNEFALDWAFMDYNLSEWLGFRAGRIKLPFGLYNETRDIDAARTSILLPQSVYVELSRDINTSTNGVGVYGDLSLSAGGTLEYQLLVGRLDPEVEGGSAKRITDLPGVDEIDNINADFMYVGALKWRTPLDGLILAYTGLTTDLNMDAISRVDAVPMWIDPATMAPSPIPGAGLPDYYIHDYTTIMDLELSSIVQHIGSVEYTIKDMVLAYEILKTTMDQTITIPQMPAVEEDVKNTAWYLSACYRFTDWFELGVYYSETVYDDDDEKGESHPSGLKSNGWLNETTVTTRFDLNEYWTLKFEVHKMDGTYYADPNEDGTYEDDWYLFAAKITARF